MPKVRDILIDVDVEVAQRKRKCHRARGKHSIPAGEACLVIRGGEYKSPKNYCRKCAKPILDLADHRLSELRLQLGN